MAILTEKFIRKPLYVQAIQVTEANFFEVAKWCDGEIRENNTEALATDLSDLSSCHIYVRVVSPRSIRQQKAFVEDWILYGEKGYKVYNDRAFKRSFDPA